MLREFIGACLTEADEAATGLRSEVVEFLVQAYAEPGSPRLRWVTGDFGRLAKTSRFKMVGGIHMDWGSVSALYNHRNHILVINDGVQGDLAKKVSDVLHEIQHYNQQIAWEGDDLSYRDRFVSGKKLPPDVKDDPMMLYEVSWDDMVDFWERRYGYERSPHEVDARDFAQRHLDEALGAIQEHLGPEE